MISLPDLRWGRCDIKSISLLPNAMARQQAGAAGCREAWLVDQAGNVTVRPGARYGQQTYQINACIGSTNTINLTLPGCTLARPA